MDDPDQNVAPTSSAFEDLMVLIRLIGDAKKFQAELDRLTTASTRIKEERTSAERALTALANRQAELNAREAAIAEQEAEQAVLNERWRQRTAELDAREKAVSEAGQLAEMRQIRSDVTKHENWLRAQLMQISGLSSRYQGILQGMPCFADVVAEIMHDNQSKQPEPVYEHDPSDAPVSMPVDALVTGTTLTRSERTGRRGADRRVEN